MEDEEEELDDTEELCPECGESIDDCECDEEEADDKTTCPDCGELNEECICDDDDEIQ